MLEIKSWILSFGSSAEVLQPPELRKSIEEEIRHLQRVYGSSSIQHPHSSTGEKA
jgi:predicted DNA-binding transcriptional regulator YafY